MLRALLVIELPDLVTHLDLLDLSFEALFTAHFLCHYTTVFPLPLVSRIMDGLFYYGQDFLQSVMVAHLTSCQQALVYCEEVDDLVSVLIKVTERTGYDTEIFMASVFDVHMRLVHTYALKRLRQRCADELQ